MPLEGMEHYRGFKSTFRHVAASTTRLNFVQIKWPQLVCLRCYSLFPTKSLAALPWDPKFNFTNEDVRFAIYFWFCLAHTLLGRELDHFGRTSKGAPSLDLRDDCFNCRCYETPCLTPARSLLNPYVLVCYTISDLKEHDPQKFYGCG